MKNIKSLVTVALAVVIIGSCKKEEPTPTNTQTPSTASKICKVKTQKRSMNSSSDTATFSTYVSTSYEYNAAGKLSKQTYNDTNGTMISYTLYDYSTNGIVDVKSFSATNTQKTHTIYKLGSNGYASIAIDGDNPQDTLSIYEYNADGYRTKDTYSKTGESTTYTITNGNVTQVVTKDKAGVSKLLYEYEYTDKPNKNSAVHFFGKGNVNLRSKSTMVGFFVEDISYTIDSNGYPSEMIYAMTQGSMQIKTKTQFTYNCQ